MRLFELMPIHLCKMYFIDFAEKSIYFVFGHLC